MKQPCEIIVAKFLPTLRGVIVRTLLTDYGLKQMEVAHAMGLTQAAVSHYFNSARGTDPELVERFPEIEQYARALAAEIAKGARETEQVARICDACQEIRAGDKFCRFHHESSRQYIEFGEVVSLNRRLIH